MEYYGRHRDEQDGYIYSPIIKQYDTSFWKTVSGSPAMAGNLLRFTSAIAASFIQHIFADVELLLTIPVKPTAGQARKWGFILPDSDNMGGSYFEVNGAVFQAVTKDIYGNTQTTAITWDDTNWTAKAIKYRIKWEAEQVVYFVNDVIVATHSVNTTDMIPNMALPIEISNGTADNLDMTYLAVRRAASII